MWKPLLPPFRKHKQDIFEKVISTGQFIYQIGESEILRQSSREVNYKDICSEVFQKKIAYLNKCMLKYRKLTGVGRGIAAVQVGIPERFSVIYMPDIKGELLIIINPVVIKKSERFLSYPEMCVSANPIIAPTIRPAWIEFEYYNEQGEKEFWNTKDTTREGKMYNRVFQHEIDHMDGIINIDRVESKRLTFESYPSYYDKASFEEVEK